PVRRWAGNSDRGSVAFMAISDSLARGGGAGRQMAGGLRTRMHLSGRHNRCSARKRRAMRDEDDRLWAARARAAEGPYLAVLRIAVVRAVDSECLRFASSTTPFRLCRRLCGRLILGKFATPLGGLRVVAPARFRGVPGAVKLNRRLKYTTPV